MNKNTVIGSIVAVLIAVGVWFGFATRPTGEISAGAFSVASTTQSSAKVFSIVISPLTSTSTSWLNDGGSDRIITDSFAQCNTVGTSLSYNVGAGIASWTLQMSTGTIPLQGLQANTTNLIANLTISTSTVDAYTASSTNPFPSPVSRIWPIGTYVNSVFNATNTATCVIGGHYLNS